MHGSYLHPDIKKAFYETNVNLNTGYLILLRDYYFFLDVTVVLWVKVNSLSI